MSKEAMKQALEAYCKTLHPLWNTGISRAEAEGFFEAGFRAAIAEAEKQEPVAWYIREKDSSTTDGCWAEKNLDICEPLYTTPQQRKPLTDEMTKQMKERCDSMEMRGAFADGWLSAEAAHGIKE